MSAAEYKVQELSLNITLSITSRENLLLQSSSTTYTQRPLILHNAALAFERASATFPGKDGDLNCAAVNRSEKRAEQSMCLS